MKIQSLYKNKSLSNMFDNLLDKFEAKEVIKLIEDGIDYLNGKS